VWLEEDHGGVRLRAAQQALISTLKLESQDPITSNLSSTSSFAYLSKSVIRDGYAVRFQLGPSSDGLFIAPKKSGKQKMSLNEFLGDSSTLIPSDPFSSPITPIFSPRLMGRRNGLHPNRTYDHVIPAASCLSFLR
jgi:hypothetical protein